MNSQNPLYLSDARQLSDLFSEIKSFNGVSSLWNNNGTPQGAILCKFDGIEKIDIFLAQPTKRVIKVVSKAFRNVFDPSVYFRIIERENGTCLIIMQYSMIIGNRWLCVLPTEEIKNVLKKVS